MRVNRTCQHCGAALVVTLAEVRRGRGKYCSQACYRHPSALIAGNFWDWVDGSDPDGCWPWTRGRMSTGHGTLRNGKTTMLAHRFAWELTFGPIPEGLVICHTCDNPPCCRPDHLALGTQVDNIVDMVTKRRDRHPRGVDQGSAKVTDDAVREIRRLRTAGSTLIAIAQQFNVGTSTVHRIASRASWTHVE